MSQPVLFEILRASLVALVVALPGTIPCLSADVPTLSPPGTTSRRDVDDLDRLLQLMRQRLTLMHDVAKAKWNAGAGQPILAPERERQVLDRVVERGRTQGLDPHFVQAFFRAQIEAARIVQQADFDRWKVSGQKPFADAKSLAALRQRIDRLNIELLDVLAEVGPRLSTAAMRQTLTRRADNILCGDDLARVRPTAIAPLRR